MMLMISSCTIPFKHSEEGIFFDEPMINWEGMYDVFYNNNELNQEKMKKTLDIPE